MKTITRLITIAGCLMLFSMGQPAKATELNYSSSDPNYFGLPAIFIEMKVSEFVKLSAREYQLIAGKKMNLKDRISFSLLKKDMNKSLKKHPDQVVKDYMATAGKSSKTALIIILIVVVAAAVALIISSSINIGPTFPMGG